MTERKLTVKQLNRYIKGVFEDETVLSDVALVGEIGEIKHSGANCYIVLKDEECAIDCVLFNMRADFLRGARVVINGGVGFYPKNGRMAFYGRKISPEGRGEIYLRFLELKDKLKKEGVFDNARPMPQNIARVGVVTSASGAVIRDIISVVRRRNPFLDIVLYPVRVQGEGAAAEIAAAIADFNRYGRIDILIVARGGGGEDDLSAFNTETVARAVRASKIFVISAVGHETDYTLCDFAASLRAPTPSVAAELAAKDLSGAAGELPDRIAKFSRAFAAFYAYKAGAAFTGAERLTRNFDYKYNLAVNAVARRADKLSGGADGFIKAGEAFLRTRSAMLDKSNPLKLLSEGYAKITRGGKVVAAAKGLKAGDAINVYFTDGKKEATVK